MPGAPSALFESAAFLMSTHMASVTATGLEALPLPARPALWSLVLARVN
jgi:hypothetical protein